MPETARTEPGTSDGAVRMDWLPERKMRARFDSAPPVACRRRKNARATQITANVSVLER